VAWRGFRRLAAAAAVGILVLLVVTSAQAIVGPSPETPIPGSSPPHAAGPQGPAQGKGREAALLTGCEQQLQPSRRPSVPTVAIVGASFTAGVGAEDPAGAWAVLLARQLRWNALVYGVPGAGYVHPGLGRKGPVSAEIARVHLGALEPSLIIVQAGHDDMSVPPALERLRVEQTVAMIRAQAPGAQIALVTVFAGRRHKPALYPIDQAIVAGAYAADPQVIIMDPLAEGWRFPRVRDGLHPSPRGDTWIANKVAGILQQHGVRPAPAGRDPALCTIAVRAQSPPVRELNRPGWRPALDSPSLLPVPVARVG
jgi:lysophospholipase L1-like esterase